MTAKKAIRRQIMANRASYVLNICDAGQAVIVHAASSGERLGRVTHSGGRRKKLPDYIIKECLNILNATTFELSRGYLLNGEPCRINDRRM